MKFRLGSILKAVSALLVIVFFVIYPDITPGRYWLSLAQQFFVFGLFAASLGLLMGYMGMNSLGHTVFFGLGAYITAIVSKRGVDPFAAAICGLIGVIILGIIIGLSTAHMRGIIFMMVTVAFSQIFWGLSNQWYSLTGGDNGLAGVPRPVLAGVRLTGANLYYLLMILFVVCIALLMWIVRTPLGLAIKGVKGSEARMRVLGYNVRLIKTLTVIISGFFAGVAGIMYVWFNSYVGTNELAVRTSAKGIVMVLVGGVGTIVGPLIGAVTLVIAEDYISSWSDRWVLFMGILYIIVVLFMKGGIVGLVQKGFFAVKALITERTKQETPGIGPGN